MGGWSTTNRALELGHSICVSHGLFVMTLAQFREYRPYGERYIDPSFAVAVLISGCIAALTQVRWLDVWFSFYYY